MGDDESADPIRYAGSLVDLVAATAGQEIGAHTFAHYYCLEPGSTREAFREDLLAAIRAAAAKGLTLRTIVFPRNQWSVPYLEVCRELGIVAFRGTEDAWFHRPESTERSKRPLKRALRLGNAYLNVLGSPTYAYPSADRLPMNIPSSQMLRPWTPRSRAFYPLQYLRIVRGLGTAARRGRIYHLWLHPHDLGAHTEANLYWLEKILRAFDRLRQKQGMRSMNMADVAQEALACRSG